MAAAQNVADDSIESGSGDSGGTIVDVTGTRGYGMTVDGWGGAGASGSSVGVTCSGQISVVFKGHGGPDERPRAVLIEQICPATAYNIGGPGTTTGNVFNGALSDDVITVGPNGYPPYSQSKKVGFNANGTKIRHYSIVTNPGTTLETITLSPASNANAGNLGTASVYYQVNVYPLDIVFSGGIGENHEKQYLIGQLVSASLSSSVLEPDEDTFEWSPSGSYYFKQFAITDTEGHKVDATEDDLDNETFALCFSAPSASASLNLTVHLEVPAGSKPSDGLELTVERPFQILAPEMDVVIAPTLGDFRIRPDNSGCILSTSAGNPIQIGASLYGMGPTLVIDVPSGFAGGTWNWIQTLVIRTSCVVGGVTKYLKDPNGNTTGHDNGWPYDSVIPSYDSSGTHWSAASSERSIWDAPSWPFDEPGSTNYHYDKDFDSNAMFLPPGSGSQHVPVYRMKWNLDGYFEKSGSTWIESSEPEEDFIVISDDPPFPDWAQELTPVNWSFQ